MPNTETIRNNKKFNVVIDSQLRGNTVKRYCPFDHIALINNPDKTPFDKEIWFCPSCGMRYGVKETEPEEKLKATFPSAIDDAEGNRHVYQNKEESLPRSLYFIKKRSKELNDAQINDQYLKYLQSKNIQIRDIDYHNPDY